MFTTVAVQCRVGKASIYMFTTVAVQCRVGKASIYMFTTVAVQCRVGKASIYRMSRHVYRDQEACLLFAVFTMC